jgi:hypothetical protein
MNGGSMKSAVRVEELHKLMPSTKSVTFLQIAGVEIFLIAFLLLNESSVFPFLLMVGAAVLTKCFEKSKLQNKIKEIVE